ncbi:MAG TPA: helix-turn-helix domain-containing protein [Novosphingobium sp.]|nr:helix-turn-helix domain-containing protein [Novosphingobium sp.]
MVRHILPPVTLRKYVTRIFLTEISLPEGEAVEDLLFPDWTGFHFYKLSNPRGETLAGRLDSDTIFSVIGARSRGLPFQATSLRQWGFGLHPLGWTRLVGAQASDYVDRVCDGRVEPAFARFSPLADTLFDDTRDPAGEFARMIRFLEDLPETSNANETLLIETFLATRDADIATVEALAEQVGCSRRTLERLCKRSFGFPPKILLSRQRFMRSLSGFVTNPSSTWTDAIDPRYHDQAHFVRDFRRFMGMTPTEYAEMAKPIAQPSMLERARLRLELERAFQGSTASAFYGVDL